jgi:hypothetical protein
LRSDMLRKGKKLIFSHGIYPELLNLWCAVAD